MEVVAAMRMPPPAEGAGVRPGDARTVHVVVIADDNPAGIAFH
jgi:hypothetical protein